MARQAGGWAGTTTAVWDKGRQTGAGATSPMHAHLAPLEQWLEVGSGLVWAPLLLPGAGIGWGERKALL